MGLDARVSCDCYVAGRTGEPPFDRDELEWEEGFLHLRDDGVDWSDEESYEPFIARERALDEWTLTCCPHPEFEVAGEWVGNWSMVRAFTGYVERADDGRLSTLRTLMPAGNGGAVTPAEARAALAELDVLRSLVVGQPRCALVDDICGQELYGYVAAYQGAIAFAGPYQTGFDPQGFFVRHREHGEVLRAMRVEQRFISGQEPVRDEKGTQARMRLTGDNGQVIEDLGTGIGTDDRDWRVVTRPTVWEDVPCVDALRTLFTASVGADQPIRWL